MIWLCTSHGLAEKQLPSDCRSFIRDEIKYTQSQPHALIVIIGSLLTSLTLIKCHLCINVYSAYGFQGLNKHQFIHQFFLVIPQSQRKNPLEGRKLLVNKKTKICETEGALLNFENTVISINTYTCYCDLPKCHSFQKRKETKLKIERKYDYF